MKTTEFGDYSLLKKLATGGMGEVFLARQEQGAGFERFVAIKRILPELSGDDDFVRMFLDEARLAARLSHPNVIQIYDLGICGDQYYLAMEFLEGRDLRRIMGRLGTKRRALAGAHAVQIIYGAAEGLHYAHNLKDAYGNPLNVIHRDVSPQNIFVSFHGTIKVLDFGIAKAEARSVRTRTGGLKGKYPYLSPEQVRGDEVDARSDVFSLGTVLWEVTIGRRLFKRDNDLLTLKAVMECQVPRPSELMNKYPKELEAIVMKSLARDPDQRYASCRAMQEDLEQFVGQYGLVLSPQKLGKFVEELFPDEPKTVTALLEELKQKPQTRSLLTDDNDGSRSFAGRRDSSGGRDELTEPSGSSLERELVLNPPDSAEDSVSRSAVKGGEGHAPLAAVANAPAPPGGFEAQGLVDMFPGIDAAGFGDDANVTETPSTGAPSPYQPPSPTFRPTESSPSVALPEKRDREPVTTTPSHSNSGIGLAPIPIEPSPDAAAIARAPTALHGVPAAPATPETADDGDDFRVDVDIDQAIERRSSAPPRRPPGEAETSRPTDDAASPPSDARHDTLAPAPKTPREKRRDTLPSGAPAPELPPDEEEPPTAPNPGPAAATASDSRHDAPLPVDEAVATRGAGLTDDATLPTTEPAAAATSAGLTDDATLPTTEPATGAPPPDASGSFHGATVESLPDVVAGLDGGTASEAPPRHRIGRPVLVVLFLLGVLAVPAFYLLYTALTGTPQETSGPVAGNQDPTSTPPDHVDPAGVGPTPAPAPAADAGAVVPSTPDAALTPGAADSAPPATADAAPPLGAMAKLIVTTSPEGLTVKIGDQRIGTAPIEAEVPAGRHRVNVRNSKGIDYTVNVEVEAGQTHTERVNVPRGSLGLRITPYAAVFIDGRSVGLTPMPPVNLRAGRHRVRLVNDSLNRSVVRNVTIRPGQRTTLRVNMASAP